MKLKRLAICISVMIVVQSPLASFGQEQNRTSVTDARQKQTATKSFDTYRLLEHARRLSDDARGLKPVDEIPLQARLADAVWPLDESLAERLLSRSFDLTIAFLKEPAGTDSASPVADPQTLFAHISSIASKHDMKLEKILNERWREATASVAGKDNNSDKANSVQLASVLLTQAANYLKSNEARARELFRQSVSLRVLQDHCFFLLNQRTQAPGITDTLFSDTLEVLTQRPLTEANEILVLSSYLFSPDGSIGYLAISGYNTANVATNMSAVAKNPSLAKRYLRLLFTKTNSNEPIPPAVAYFALKNLVPQYQALAPELLNDVYAKMGNLAPGVSKDDSWRFNDAHKSFNASESEETAEWEKRFQNADKRDNDDWRNAEYFTILFGYLLPKKDFTRAALIANKISNQELKEKSEDVVNLTVLQAKLEKAETASSVSESDCNKLKIPLVRVMALSSLGHARLKQKATGDALRLFDQAAGAANQIKEDQDRLQAKLMLVQLSSDVDSSVGFASAVGAFKEINKFPDFNMNRSAFSLKVVVYGLKNEIPLDSPGPSSLVSAVTKMCRVNCEETFHTSRLLEKKEIRMWATLVAVRTGLRESSRNSSGGLQ